MKFYVTSRLSENIAETPDGFLICTGVSIARTGEMEYGPGETPIEVGADGRVRVTRDAKEVFRPETIASFEGKPVTIGHPAEFVSPENWQTLAMGTVHNVRRGQGEQENDLIADLLITVKRAIDMVKSGLREVSCGYEAGYVQTGEGLGFQEKIVGNHLALVEEGRAGSSYAINDHKGKGSMKKLGDKIKAIFAKAQDDALALTKTEDEGAMPTVANVSYDDFKKSMDDFGKKMDSFMGKKSDDATTPPTESTPAKVVAKDDEVSAGLEGRLKKLEDMVAALMSKMPAGDEEGDDLVTDEDEEEEESEDAAACEDEDEGEMVGDAASRIEILAPGMNPKAKDAKKKAIIAAYATKDGKAEIHKFTGGKAPNLKSEEVVDMLFIGVSEGLKAARSDEFALARKKTADFQSQMGIPKGARTPEDVNAANEKHYAAK